MELGTIAIILVALVSAFATHSDITRQCAKKGSFPLLTGVTISCSVEAK